MFSLCIVCIFNLSFVLYFQACTTMNGTVYPNCADVLSFTMMCDLYQLCLKLMRSVLRRSEVRLDGDWRRSVAANVLAAFTDSRCKRFDMFKLMKEKY